MIIDQQCAKGFYQSEMYGIGLASSWVCGSSSLTTLAYRWEEVVEIGCDGGRFEIDLDGTFEIDCDPMPKPEIDLIA